MHVCMEHGIMRQRNADDEQKRRNRSRSLRNVVLAEKRGNKMDINEKVLDLVDEKKPC